MIQTVNCENAMGKLEKSEESASQRMANHHTANQEMENPRKWKISEHQNIAEW